MPNTIYVVGGAIEHEGRYLVARRSTSMDLPGLWEFPGGKIEQGETPRDTLRRELAEELGIEVEVNEFVATGVVPKGDRMIKLDVYRCRWTGGELDVREHAEVRWVAPSEMSGLKWAQADWPAVAALGGSFRNSV